MITRLLFRHFYFKEKKSFCCWISFGDYMRQTFAKLYFFLAAFVAFGRFYLFFFILLLLFCCCWAVKLKKCNNFSYTTTHTHIFHNDIYFVCVWEFRNRERERIKVSDVCSKAFVVRKWEESKKMIWDNKIDGLEKRRDTRMTFKMFLKCRINRSCEMFSFLFNSLSF